MLEFVICEDNEKEMSLAIETVNKVMSKYDFEYRISKHSIYSKELNEEINNKGKQKIYILDIELGKVSGLEIASKIREHDWDSFIIITTISKDYKNDVFFSRLLVVDYIVKNVFYSKRLFETLDKIINRLNGQNVLIYKYKNCVNRIPFGSILYIEKLPLGKKSLIVTLNGNSFETPFTILEMRNKLGIRFRQTHQSCLINIDKVEKIDFKEGIIYFSDGSSTNLLSSKYKKELDSYVRSI